MKWHGKVRLSKEYEYLHSEEPSVADYALEVFGIPDSALESEIVSHFEELTLGRA